MAKDKKKPAVRRGSPEERARRERIRNAALRAELKYTPNEIRDACDLSNQQYVQFKKTLYLGRPGLARLEQFLVGKRYMPPPTHEPTPYPTGKAPVLQEIRQMLSSLSAVAEDAEEHSCSAAQLGYLQNGVVLLHEKLLPKLVDQIEEGTSDTTSSSRPRS